MKIKIAQLIQLNSTLQSLANSTMPAKVSYAVSKILKQIATALHDASVEHIALYSTYGVLDTETQMVIIPDDKRAEFDAANEVIVGRVIDVDLFGITLESFEDTAVTPAMLLALEPVLRSCK